MAFRDDSSGDYMENGNDNQKNLPSWPWLVKENVNSYLLLRANFSTLLALAQLNTLENVYAYIYKANISTNLVLITQMTVPLTYSLISHSGLLSIVV